MSLVVKSYLLGYKAAQQLRIKIGNVNGAGITAPNSFGNYVETIKRKRTVLCTTMSLAKYLRT